MSKTICRLLAAGLVFCFTAADGADTPAAYLGANSCASSSCHGGGAASQNQFLVWSLKDFHSQRPAVTLATARAKQIADAAGIADATTDERCTTCHAPLAGVSENLRGKDFKIGEGVSCESCHGPAGSWIRSHTRTDYTRADRTAAGMRDLQNLYVRANICVACHQNVGADILVAGHPELIFELDGQSVAEPKHWSAEKNGNGAQAWLVGQAVALREMSWQLAQEKSPTEKEINRWKSLYWVAQDASALDARLPAFETYSLTLNDLGRIQKWSDQLARVAATLEWMPTQTRKCLSLILGSQPDFGSKNYSSQELARRAERLVLALDRLVAALPELKNNEPVQSALNQLFKDAQSLPDFKPADFAAHLDEFQKQLPLSKM